MSVQTTEQKKDEKKLPPDTPNKEGKTEQKEQEKKLPGETPSKEMQTEQKEEQKKFERMISIIRDPSNRSTPLVA